ncbi:Pantoate--beta-alanine ligase [hydrothermal vent metagenome]|uniref:pantoate--beta-alanine ligase (AMP-forming) n=1 Tax=hydrothermal vent metagenome TaxID=652676 RepID=A0A3B0YDC7_9ZZZZ
MRLIENKKVLDQIVGECKADNKTIAFVPTLGNLHAGHLSLVEIAKAQCDLVLVSIFVNPTQFEENSDLDHYPRTLGADSFALVGKNVDFLYTPHQEDIYPDNTDLPINISFPGISNILCGHFRPGHFEGVALIVSKLFNLVQPDVAVFGEKDFQQLLLIKMLVRQLSFPVKIISGNTVREADGLAMSSRNQYLNDAERIVAPELYRCLQNIKRRIKHGESQFEIIEQQAKREIEESGFEPEYISIRNAHNLKPASMQDKEFVVLLAANLGDARLIDNIRFVR